MVNSLLLYIASVFFIWKGAGLIVSSVDRFSKTLKLSSFTVSFLVLGLLTSTPEFAVGFTAVSEGAPQVFIGNLIGGIAIIYLFIIPMLAIVGNGITLNHKLDAKMLRYCLLVCLAPSLFVMDKVITNMEAVVMIVAYGLLVYFIERKQGLMDENHKELFSLRAYSLKDIIRLLVGVAIVFISGRIIVDKTIYFSEILGISSFYISLLLLSFGTNLPELSLAVRSVLSGKKDIAFGDYLGSAAANTFLFGIFSLLNGGEVLTESGYLPTFIFLLVGLTLFYFFARSKNIVSRAEGIVLLGVYIAFVITESLVR